MPDAPCSIDAIAIERGLGARRIALEEIAADEREGKCLLGTAYGHDLLHCIYLAGNHCKEFSSRARWYFISGDVDDELRELRRSAPGAVRIEFYAASG